MSVQMETNLNFDAFNSFHCKFEFKGTIKCERFILVLAAEWFSSLEMYSNILCDCFLWGDMIYLIQYRVHHLSLVM